VCAGIVIDVLREEVVSTVDTALACGAELPAPRAKWPRTALARPPGPRHGPRLSVTGPLVASGARVDRVVLVGRGVRSPAIRRIAPTVLGRPVLVPPAGEYVGDGDAREAAWTLSGNEEPARWNRAGVQTYDGDIVRAVRDGYAEARDLTVARQRSVADVAPLTEHKPASPTR
jgi:hypothetical protein